MGIYGQDWASYQSKTPATKGLSFAFVKVTQGSGYVNPDWVAQRATAKGAGLVFGAYHYPNMANSPASEADYFLKQVTFTPGDMVCLDWEGYDTANKGVSKAKQAAYKDAWLHYVKAKLPHNPVGLYCNVDYWRNVDKTGFYGDFLWIATGGLPAGQPGITAPWLFHQYSAATVDKDFCHLASTDALRSWALSFSEDDMAFTAADAAVMLNTPVPGAKMASGYVPKVWEMLHGAMTADSQITALAKQVTGLSAAVASLAALVGKDEADAAAIVGAVQQAIATAVIHVEVGTVPAPTK